MPQNPDPAFFDRANAHINLANDQLNQDVHGQVSASMMYASARFSTSLTASGYKTATEMASHKNANIDYFVREYRMALEEHMDDYIKNFDRYMAMSKNIG
ncbi:DUF3144 domain-containing protein [Rhodoferax sp.]|uniref:DUF3144 domain-containing protein n=1 Tax=Rhodoferax sp. TaxID=50421 RepID=UPI0019E6CD47|nr:DUF3144 domain-containing protein [Rhodoferax sp.]MBE0474744.1 DUF3144 domain-containing protein [Rhodoferax sp.]